MESLDDIGQKVFHLRAGTWHHVPWSSWMRFRGLGDAWAPLPHVGAGEHYFVVCVATDGRLFNILPHRYLIDSDGHIADDGYFGVLWSEEIERYKALNERHYEYPQAHPLTAGEQRDFDGIRDRLWRSWLPPAAAARELTRVAVALPDEGDAAWHMLEACGLSRGTSGPAS
jgi:hypothetical protein